MAFTYFFIILLNSSTVHDYLYSYKIKRYIVFIINVIQLLLFMFLLFNNNFKRKYEKYTRYTKKYWTVLKVIKR